MDEAFDEFLGEPNWQILHPLNLIVIALFAILAFQMIAIGALAFSNMNRKRKTVSMIVPSGDK